jgi:ribosomal protein L9
MNPFDQLAEVPGMGGDEARYEADYPIGPTESPPQAAQRYAEQDRANKAVQRVRAEDFANRAVPTYRDETGDVQPVRDASGAALTDFDKRNGVAYDSSGNPQRISYGESGPPKLRDAYSGIAETLDEQTGDRYLAPKGLPWRWTGSDPKIVAQREREKADKELAQAAQAQGAQNTLEQTQVTLGERSFKNQRKSLGLLVPSLADPESQEMGRDDALAAVNAHFDNLAQTPEATAKAHGSGENFRPEAQQLQAKLTAQRQNVLQRANATFDLRDRLDQQRTRLRLIRRNGLRFWRRAQVI